MKRVPQTVKGGSSVATPIPEKSLPVSAVPASVLQAGFGVVRPEAHVPNETPAAGGRAPFLSFYHEEQGAASDVVSACASDDEGVFTGMPYVGNVGDSFARLDGAGFVLWGTHVPYWCTIDGGNQLVDVWLTPQAVWEERVDRKTGKTRSHRVLVDGLKVHKAAAAMILVLPGRKALPEILQPATLAIANLQKNTQSSSILRAFDNAEKTTTPEFAKAHPQLVSSAPPGIRVVSRFVVNQKQGRGFAYALIDSTAAPITMPQMEAVTAWGASAALQDERERIEEVFQTRVAAIKAKAEETASR